MEKNKGSMQRQIIRNYMIYNRISNFCHFCCISIHRRISNFNVGGEEILRGVELAANYYLGHCFKKIYNFIHTYIIYKYQRLRTWPLGDLSQEVVGSPLLYRIVLKTIEILSNKQKRKNKRYKRVNARDIYKSYE